MPLVPLHIDMRGRHVLVAGGGAVAERKVRTLLGSGAKISIITPEATSLLSELAESGVVSLFYGCYRTEHLSDAFLVIAATDCRDTNRRIAAEAQQHGILVNVVNAPDAGDCIFPAVLTRGDLEISISTGGTFPGFASELRDMLAGIISDEFGTILETLAAEREKLLTDSDQTPYYTKILRSRARELIQGLSAGKDQVP